MTIDHHQNATKDPRHDRLGRRLRFRRCHTGKRLILGARDCDILGWLHRYRFLRQSQLLALIQPQSAKRFTERLGDLYHETGYINRPSFQASQFDSRCTSMLYEISEAGQAYLVALDQLPTRAVTFSRRTRPRYNPQFLHTMMIIEALLTVEMATIVTPGQRFVPVDEILAKAPKPVQQATNPLSAPVTIRPGEGLPGLRSALNTHIIPDALYGIEYLIDGQQKYRFWALECERTSPRRRNTIRVSSTQLKQAAYDSLIQSKAFQRHWGIPNLKLRIVTREGIGS
uniref:replication-relaxation family protein n=1 Tax=Pararhizobium sp. IMCC3301 TaxID=3067904 RepID=UPI0027416447|nr:replication-relaxation family protein [Pararhizobium sp. IMCC3301]